MGLNVSKFSKEEENTRSYRFVVDNNGVKGDIHARYWGRGVVGDKNAGFLDEDLTISYELHDGEGTSLSNGYFCVRCSTEGLPFIVEELKAGDDEINSDVLEVLVSNLPVDIITRMIPKEVK